MSGTAQQSLEIVNGGIVRGDEPALLRRIRKVAPAAALIDWQPVRHAGSARKLGALVRESARFAGADLLGLDGVRRYHLRRGGRSVLLRHGTVDVWTFAEIFGLRLYEPPPAVVTLLERAGSPLVVDLGANIGLFGVDVLTRHPDARVVGYEPEAENCAIHRHLIDIAGAGSSWSLIEACAGPHEGTVAFLPGQETGSRVLDAPGTGTVNVPMHDVMPLLADADLVKIDIEGGEWAILADGRFASVRAAVLEYHPQLCPGDDPRGVARELLAAHGFEITELFHEPESGVGMLWAVRP